MPFRLLFLVLWLLQPALALHAVTYPTPATEGGAVNDFADVITTEHEVQITRRSREVLTRTGIPIVAVTIRSLAEQGAGNWSIERYAAGLYNEWGIGSGGGGNRGVLLLVAVKDRKLRIATGAGFGNSWDGPAREIIDDEIVPRFRQGDFSGGINRGVEAIAQKLFSTTAERLPAPGSPQDGASAARDPGAAASPSGRDPDPVLPSGEGARWNPRGTGVGIPGRGGSGIGGIIFIGFAVMILMAVISVLRGIFRPRGSRQSYGGGWRTPSGGSGWGGWGGLVTGGLLGYFGSQLLGGSRRRSSSHDDSFRGGGSWGGGSSGGGFSGGGSSFGGGYTSGGGASGSW